MFCSNCGNNVPDGAKFCDGCGKSMGEAPVSAHTPPRQEYSQTNQSNYHPQNTQTTYTAPRPQQSSYQTAPYASQSGLGNDAPLTIGNYIGMMFLSAIPIVGFILMLMWAFGSSVNRNKKNWACAMLIMGAISVVLMIIFSSVLASMMDGIFGGGYY